MTVKVSTIGLKGLEGYKINVEVQLQNGIPSMVIIGLPDASIKESKQRVLSVLSYLNCEVAGNKIIVNLLPAEQKKNGTLFDLAIAIGILKEQGIIKRDIPKDIAFLGSLSLDGKILAGDGLLASVLAAKSLGFKKVYLPMESDLPIEMIDGLDCVLVKTVTDVIDCLNGKKKEKLFLEGIRNKPNIPKWRKDFSYIIGQEQAKRGLEIAAAGEHNVLMSGPPGCGKSLLAETFPTILPSLPKQTQLEVMSLYQLAGEELQNDSIPPFRSPHHSASSVSLVGGGSYPKPGEISLSHGGVLFLDEMAEFPKKALEMLRQLLESRKITISRVHSKVTYPASFILIGAMNPCPCGYWGSLSYYCTCTPRQIKNYHQRISGPILDRMDILLNLKSTKLKQGITGERSTKIRDRVIYARERQYRRYQEEISNGKVSLEKLIAVSPLSECQHHFLMDIASKQNWSSRIQGKIIRVARTISDLANEEAITDDSLKEAMQLREVSPENSM